MVHSLKYCNQFSCPFWWDVNFDRWSSGRYTHDPHRVSREKNCGSFFKKHNFDEQVQLFDIYRRFFSCLHLAVGLHHRRRTSWCPHDLQLSRVKVFLTDHIHTRSWINYKLPLLQLFCWRSREYPFLRVRVECSLVFFLSLYMFLSKIPSLASDTSLLSFSLFMGPALIFHSVGLRWWGILTFFPIDEPLFSRILAWRSVDFVNRTLWIGSKTFCIKISPRLFSTLRNRCFRVLRVAIQLWYTSHNITAFLSSLSFFFLANSCSFSTFCWLFIILVMRKQTLTSRFAQRFCFVILTLGRMPIFTRRSRASTFQMISALMAKNGPMATFAGYFSSSTHFDLVKRLAQKAWRQCVLVFVHCLGFRAGNCIDLLANTGLFLSTGNSYLSSFSADSSLSTLNHCSWSIFPCLTSKFRNRSFWSKLLFTIVVNFW